eukprot:CAMPEP_0115883298 /NCGR_PEP_ID=MMETSP0287-20121206/29491_1 /TAXON_ID=412157 /ORGANISM="Chrysochromulina rotalis, Strain UIO044" /LENGTH=33 /DNA_ID= /DNA_START= /DNA_END= /DNA_ORIENTATION=
MTATAVATSLPSASTPPIKSAATTSPNAQTTLL